MLIPEAWSKNDHMNPQKRAFYEYHASLMEPWDGPAAIAFTDGRSIGATLDRNGLRPARYLVTHDGLILMASETGVLPVKPEDVKLKGRLQPGKMLLVDTAEGRLISDKELKASLYGRNPYQLWIKENQIRLDELPDPPREIAADPATLLRRQRAFGQAPQLIAEDADGFFHAFFRVHQDFVACHFGLGMVRWWASEPRPLGSGHPTAP